MTRLAAQAKEHHETQEAHRRFGVRKLLTVDDVADHLGVPKSTVYEAVRQNRIGGIVRIGRMVRFDPDKLEAWIEAGGQALPGGWKQEATE